jgi:hypothetical protein
MGALNELQRGTRTHLIGTTRTTLALKTRVNGCPLASATLNHRL